MNKKGKRGTLKRGASHICPVTQTLKHYKVLLHLVNFVNNGAILAEFQLKLADSSVAKDRLNQ